MLAIISVILSSVALLVCILVTVIGFWLLPEEEQLREPVTLGGVPANITRVDDEQIQQLLDSWEWR